MTVRKLDSETVFGHITGLGYDNHYAKVLLWSKEEIDILKYHLRVSRPAGFKSKAVITSGEFLGRVGTVQSAAKRHKGKWVLRELSTDKLMVAEKNHLASVHYENPFPWQEPVKVKW